MTKLDLSRTVKKTMKERLGRLVTTLFFVGILLTGTLTGGTQALESSSPCPAFFLLQPLEIFLKNK